MDQFARINQAVYPEGERTTYQYTSDVDKARAKKAYESINDMISQKDLNSDNLFEDLISEKAFALDRFADTQRKSPQDSLIEESIGQVQNADGDDIPFNQDDQNIKSEIQKIMEEYASDKAKGKSTYNQYEDQS